MLKKHAKSFAWIFRLCDAFLISLAFYGAYFLRNGLGDINPVALPLQFRVFLSAYLLVAWFYLSQQLSLYSSKRFTRFRVEIFDVCKITISALIIAILPSFFIREHPLSRLFLIYFCSLLLSGLISFRLILRETLKYIRRRGYNYRQVLIVGQNSRSANLANKILESPHLGLRILGFIDAPNDKVRFENLANFNIMGNLEDLEKILRRNVVDEVLVTLPMKSFYSEIYKILSICEKTGVEFKIPTDLFSLKVAKSKITNYDEYQMIDFYTSPRMSCQLLIKRFIDLMFSAILLIIMAPLFVLIGLLIKIDSGGPVFFKQKRVGYNGRIFCCLKFRTMVKNAENIKKNLLTSNEMDGPVFKMKNDPRVTRVGKILRRTSIDELPQLINVFWGDMSLVGPRPPIPNEVNQYDLDDRRRLSMKPGITCLWQISGRNSIPFEKWMELDRQYIEHWSLGLDFKILLKTIPVVLKGSGQ
jgi:exopolysaccharide biosynthesis polyprenyl glycosylphosphotransferase